jgi:hypothetical protein
MNNIYIDLETIPNQSPDYRMKVRANIKPPATRSEEHTSELQSP